MKAVPSAQARGPSKLAKTSAHHSHAQQASAQRPQWKKLQTTSGEDGDETSTTKKPAWIRPKKAKKRFEPVRRIPEWRLALYGPKLYLPATNRHRLKLDLAANEIDCFGEEELYPKFDAVAFLKSNQMLTKHNVPGSQEKDDFFSLIPDDKKHLIRSLPKLLTVLHKAGYCIHEDFTLDDLVIGGQFKFFLRGHLTLVPCTQKGMDCDYKRAAKVITDMFLISCGDSAMSLIPGEMKHYIHILESGGSRYSNLILTHVALLPLCSRGTVLRKFHDEILEVLPREGLEATKNKILSEIDITSWDTIAKDNKHLSTWFRYRQGVGKPYDPKKPSHFLSLQRNVVSHKNMKTVFEESVIELVLFACYPVQLCQMQLGLWKYNRLGHLHVEEDFNDGCAHLTASMARCAPWNAQELVASQVHVAVDASMLRLLEIEDPAAKIILELAAFQGCTRNKPMTAILIASELIQRGLVCLRNKIDTTTIFSGYKLALLEAGKFIEEKMAFHVDKIGEESLVWCARKSLGSKFVNGDSDLIAKLVVEAVQAVKTTNGKGAVKYPLKGINILKDQNKSIKNSYLLNGYALNTGRASKGLPASVSPARIACLDFSLQKTQTQTNAHVLDSDSMQPRNIYERKQRIEKILRAGANVVLTTKGIDDIALKHFVEAGIVAVRRVRKRDMHHVSKATGATTVTFADFEYEKEFDSSFLGHADLVVEQRICDDDVLLIKGTKNTNKVFIVLGVNDFILHEKDQCLYDALKTVKETLEANMVVPGSGAVEAALSVHLKKIAAKLTSQEQLVVAEFAESLLIIPKVLCAEAARNEAKDAAGLLSMLKAYHHASQTNTDKKQFSSMGLDPLEAMVCDSIKHGVLEPAMTKLKIIQFATKAAIGILQSEDVIWLAKEGSSEDDDDK